MTTKTDGGAAFPVVHPDGMGAQYFGFSVRDYFAAKAMESLASNLYHDQERLARSAYKIADAMLAERENKS